MGFHELWWIISVSSLVIIDALVFEILCGKTGRQTSVKTPATATGVGKDLPRSGPDRLWTFWHGECCSGIVKRFDEERAKLVKCPSSVTAVEKEIRTIYEMVTHLSGKSLPCINPNCPLPSHPTQRAMQIYSQHHILLAFIRSDRFTSKLIFRPHHMGDAAYYYRRSSMICVSVCLCASVGHVYKPHKNWWTDRDAVWGADSGKPKEPCTRWGWDSYWKGQLWGVFGPLKALVIPDAVYAVKGIMQSSIMACSKRDHSVFNNGTTCDVAFRQTSLTTCFVFYNKIFTVNICCLQCFD